VSTSAIIDSDTWSGGLSLDKIFDQPSKPLEVDLGCGKGRFLVSRAMRFPDTNFMGVDRQMMRVRKTDKKIQQQHLGNVRLLRTDISYAVQHLFPRESISSCYLFFPDPWPKRRHHARRIVNPMFSHALLRSLTPGGCIHIATDHEEYAEAMCTTFAINEGFRKAEPFIPDDDETTEFEQLFVAKGQRIQRCSFRKTEQGPPPARVESHARLAHIAP
jgi:tRNA (guanine-N7-)-methyltransferase